MLRYSLILVTILLIAACSLGKPATNWPTESWETAAPEEKGIDPAVLNRVQKALQSKMYGYIDRFVIVHDGYLILDVEYDIDYERINRNKDQNPDPYNYSSTVWHPYYQDSKLHTLQSVTKSITALVIGAAIQQGDFPQLDTPVMNFFSEYQVKDLETKNEITIADLLTMRSGIFWNEWDYDVGDERNTVTQMETSQDWIQYVLSLPMSHRPGEAFVYNSGGSQLLSAIFKSVTGLHVDEYAEQHLFEPLGIDEYYWKKTPQGFADTEGGLYLIATDLAKIGYLVLQDGHWGGEQIVANDWIEMMTSPHVQDIYPDDPELDFGYGYQWWLLNPLLEGSEIEADVYAGFGYGGQRLFVVPDFDIVAVIYGWNIYGPQRSTIDLFIDEVLPAAGE